MRSFVLLCLALSTAFSEARAQDNLVLRIVDVNGAGSAAVYDSISEKMNKILDGTGIPECRSINITLEHVGRFLDPNINALPIGDNTIRLERLQQVVQSGGNVLGSGPIKPLALQPVSCFMLPNFGGQDERAVLVDGQAGRAAQTALSEGSRQAQGG